MWETNANLSAPPKAPPAKIPHSISKYIVDYYIRNSDVLLSDTNLRTVSQNGRRSAAYKNLITELREEFGFEANEKKLRNHFDHIRSKVIVKGMSLKKGTNAEKRYRTKTGGGRSIQEKDFFEKSNNQCPFDSPSEQALWEFFDKTPMTVPFKEGESSVGKKKAGHPEEELLEDDDAHFVEPNMEDFESDSEDDRRPRNARVTERDIIQEQFRLFR
ncbi:unnamed protein product, partial [Cylicostephanus goldi]